MKKPPVKDGIAFWLLGGAGVVLAIWQYYGMVSDHTN
jgi:hypothetical protein